jgi:hypothetical protein
MLTTMVLQLVMAGSMQASMPAMTIDSSIAKLNSPQQANALAYSGRVAPGPDHGDNPNREVHGDPYYGSTGNGPDPYAGSTSNGSDNYGGYFPGAPAPKDPYGGNIPD